VGIDDQYNITLSTLTSYNAPNYIINIDILSSLIGNWGGNPFGA
jgi:hypothetical protein